MEYMNSFEDYSSEDKVSTKTIVKLSKKYHMRPHFTCQECGEISEFLNQFLRHLQIHSHSNTNVLDESRSQSTVIIESMNIRAKNEAEHVLLKREQEKEKQKLAIRVEEPIIQESEEVEAMPNNETDAEQPCPNASSSSSAIGEIYDSPAAKSKLNENCSVSNQSKSIISEDVKTLSCAVCLAEFSSWHSYNLHITKRSHTFTCKFCSKVFSHQQQLTIHLRRHNRRRKVRGSGAGRPAKLIPDLKCDTCGKMFRCKVALGCHRKKHEREEEKESANNANEETEGQNVKDKSFICKRISPFKLKISTGTEDENSSSEGIPTPSLHENNGSDKVIPSDTSQVGSFPFPCQECPKKFTSYYLLKAHSKTHSQGKQTFLCRICFKEFKDRQSVNKHSWIVHRQSGISSTPTSNDSRRYTCKYPKCAKEFSDIGKLSTHLIKHKAEGEFECENCGIKYQTQQYLALHRFHAHGIKSAPREPYACEVANCPRKFAFLCQLKKHLKAHTEKGKFHCETCGINCKNRQLLDIHKFRIHGIKVQVFACAFESCARKFKYLSQLTNHLKLHTTQSEFPCETCAINCRSRNQLTIHNIKAHGIKLRPKKSFSCKYENCPLKFTYICELKKHLELHEIKGEFPCGHCGRQFQSQQSLASHSMRLHGIHLSQMPNANAEEYGCTFVNCPRKFTSKCLLKRHLDLHNLKGDFECEKCGRKFRSQFGLGSHLSRTHGVQSPHTKTRKIFTCKQCSKTFENYSLFRVHLKSHDPILSSYICDICNKLFYGPRGLDAHRRKEHASEYPSPTAIAESTAQSEREIKSYNCEFCDKIFSNSRGMLLHKRVLHSVEYAKEMETNRIEREKTTPTAVRNLPCDKCSRLFVNSIGLRVHQYLTHRNNRKQAVVKKNRVNVKCEVCQREFPYQSALNKHFIISHTTEKPFTCDLCDKKYRQSSNLYQHKRQVHKIESDPKKQQNSEKIKEFQCEKCNQSFSFSRAFKFHMKSHEVESDPYPSSDFEEL